MALTADREVKLYASQELIDAPVDDNVVIYKGAFVGRNRATGYARQLTAGDEFLGVAYRRADNTGAGHAAGAVSVRLHQRVDIVHALSGAALGDVGKDVYATDAETLSLSGLTASRVGRIVGREGTNLVRVRCQPTQSLSGALECLPIRLLADADVALTLDHLNRVLLMGNTTGRTVTLPTAASARAGSWLRLVKTSADAAAVTIDGADAETIDGAATLATVDAQYDVAHLLCTGTEWVVLSRDVA